MLKSNFSPTEYNNQSPACRGLSQKNEGAHLNAFISILTGRALAIADEIDQQAQRSLAGKLAGLILSIKGNIHVEGEIQPEAQQSYRILSHLMPNRMPELPLQRRNRIVMRYKISEYHANRLTEDTDIVDYFEQVSALVPGARWIINEILPILKE